MPDPTAAARAARYRRRKHVEDIARFAGWEPMDALVFTKDGKHRLVSLDGVMIPLVPEDHAPVESKATPHDRPKVYAPKTIPAEDYAGWKAAVLKAQPTRQAVIDALTDKHDKFESAGDTTMAKQNAQLRKMVEAIPDTPDWYLSIPGAETTP